MKVVEQEQLCHQGALEAAADFASFQKVAQLYGAKAAGLFGLPVAWVPKFVAVPVSFYEEWRRTGTLNKKLFTGILNWVSSESSRGIIVRSSSRGERITDRGKYRSETVSVPNEQTLTNAILSVFAAAKETDSADAMGLVIQSYRRSTMEGHLSNEVRLSPTRNQWVYEIEVPWASSRGLNSKLATSPDPAIPLPSQRNPHQTLRSIGRWCCDHFKPRCHLEWLADGSDIYIVQLDFEWREFDSGTDPHATLYNRDAFPDQAARNNLLQFQIGSETRWKKLQNLSEFDFGPGRPAPILYEITSKTVLNCGLDPSYRLSVVEEVGRLTANRAVVRTDVDQKGFSRFNLPRTDTVTAAEAVEWCIEQLGLLRNKGADSENVTFLVHAFLPSLASAWAYADPVQNEVQVDALWGLPDGLQVLPVDTYEVIPARNLVVKTPSTFKPKFLCESEDGQWSYVNVLRSKGRSRVLLNQDILEIARRTKAISEKIGEFAQIMWFCGIPPEYGVGRNLPWFRSREKLDPAPRTEDKYKSFPVRRIQDLANLPKARTAIEFLPDPDQIRSEEFLAAVIAKAREFKFPVKLNGSVLGHIYYKLCEQDVGIILPNASKYKRIRSRRVFGKIVRDKIAMKIASGGEEAIEAILAKSDALYGLSGKALEELEELLRASSLDEKTAELADVLEVVRGLAHEIGIGWDELVARANDKKDKAGGFLDRKVLVETSLPRTRESSSRLGEVRLSDFSAPSVDGARIEFPVSGLLNTVERKSISFQIPDFALRMQVALKGGKIILNLQNIEEKFAQDDAQGELFK